jgi:hypothetical protein
MLTPTIPADAIPWKALQITSIVKELEIAHMKDASTNSAIPDKYIFLNPFKSARKETDSKHITVIS